MNIWIKSRIFLFQRGASITWMGAKLMFWGLISPTDSFQLGWKIKKTKDGYTLTFNEDKSKEGAET